MRPPKSAMRSDSPENEKEYRPVGETNGLENGKFPGPLTDGDGHGISGNQEQRKKYYGADAQDKEFDVPELLGPAGGKGGLRLRLGLIRRVGKHIVNCLGNARGVVRVIQPEDVPANISFEGLRHALFEIVPLEPELGFVILWPLSVIDAVDVEIPGSQPRQKGSS